MSTPIDISNMAVAHVGKGTLISSLTEASVEAKTANLFYKPALKATLREFQWPFATHIMRLQLVKGCCERPNCSHENPDECWDGHFPFDEQREWRFRYQYPSDCLEARRILSDTRNDSRKTLVPYRIMGSKSGRQIHTDQCEARLEYTMMIDNAGLFDSDFVLAVSYKQAMYMLPRLSAGDPLKIMERLEGEYNKHIALAKVNAANEDKHDPEPPSSFAASRRSGHFGGRPDGRFPR